MEKKNTSNIVHCIDYIIINDDDEIFHMQKRKKKSQLPTKLLSGDDSGVRQGFGLFS